MSQTFDRRLDAIEKQLGVDPNRIHIVIRKFWCGPRSEFEALYGATDDDPRRILREGEWSSEVIEYLGDEWERPGEGIKQPK
jgi:hypothetical protein